VLRSSIYPITTAIPKEPKQGLIKCKQRKPLRPVSLFARLDLYPKKNESKGN
jgi:hypothetical protein